MTMYHAVTRGQDELARVSSVVAEKERMAEDITRERDALHAKHPGPSLT
jgi:hypothetical protein